MIQCLHGYLNTGLVESKFVNLKIRQLSAETSHDFIEWCGLINGSQPNELLRIDYKIRLHDAYIDFIDQYPDYAPKAKLTISGLVPSFADANISLSPLSVAEKVKLSPDPDTYLNCTVYAPEVEFLKK